MISIDPGVDYYAYAEWVDYVLKYVAVAPIGGNLKKAALYVMERPRIRRFGKRRAPDETVIALAISAGRLSDRAPTVWLDAGTWSRGQSKKQRQPKILARLRPEEQAFIKRLPKKEQDHVLDAIGIGMYYLEKEGLRTFHVHT